MSPSLGLASKSASSISQQLRKSLEQISYKPKDIRKIDIISPELCDDVVQRLQASFPPSRPFDIIDIHPGVCLWSSKVHDALEPRRHILVEPNQDAYQSYIDPLLHRPGSKYRHVLSLSDLFTKFGVEYLPDQVPVGSKNISKDSINHSLLILANLTNYGTNRSSEGSVGIKHIRDYVNRMMSPEQSFHHYGLVRMLAWLGDDEKATFIPRTITDRRKFTVRLDMVAQVTEVAGGAFKTHRRSEARRQNELTVQGEQLVAQRAKDAGIDAPEHRRPPPSILPWYEIDLVDGALDQLRRLPRRLPWQDKLLALHEKWGKGKPDIGEKIFKLTKDAPLRWKGGRPRTEELQGQVEETLGAKGGESLKTSRGGPQSEELREWRMLRTRFLTVRKQNITAHEWANRQNELDKAELKLLAGARGAKHLASRKAIRRKADELHAEIDKARVDLFRLVRKYIDDRRGFEQDPPLLQWDRRTAEPLIVGPEEFYPATKLALLDLRPDTQCLEKLSDFEKRTCFDFVCHCLFRYPAQPIRDILTMLVQGTLDDFLEKVPDLLDPSKGGNLNINDLRARTLPLNLIVQLVLALEKWPFRKQTFEMLVMMSGGQKNRMLRDDKKG